MASYVLPWQVPCVQLFAFSEVASCTEFQPMLKLKSIAKGMMAFEKNTTQALVTQVRLQAEGSTPELQMASRKSEGV